MPISQIQTWQQALEEMITKTRYSSGMDLLQLFKGLSDPVRLRIAHLLIQQDELCVCHLTDALSLPQSTVSRHLNTLRNAGLVTAERRGKWVYYRLHDANEPIKVISDLIRHNASSEEQFQRDLSKLKESTC